MASMKTTSPLEIFKLREAEKTRFCLVDLEAGSDSEAHCNVLFFKKIDG